MSIKYRGPSSFKKHPTSVNSHIRSTRIRTGAFTSRRHLLHTLHAQHFSYPPRAIASVMFVFKSSMPWVHLLFSSTAYLLPSTSARTIQSRQVDLNTLFGPITLPSVQISNINITLFNFGDEVFDISSISIFGDINDNGDCSEAADAPAQPETRPGGTVVLGPASIPASINITDIQVSLFNFQDEVFDISSISLFGDVNDGSCPAAS